MRLLLNESILGVCLIYFLALLWNQAKDFMRPNDATIPKRISHHSLQPVWHSLAAMAAWFVLPKAEALAIGLAVAAAWGLWTARNNQAADLQRSGGRELLSWRSSSHSASLGC